MDSVNFRDFSFKQLLTLENLSICLSLIRRPIQIGRCFF